MIALPLPLVSSLVLGFLLVWLLLRWRGVPWLAALLGGLVLQGAIITAAQHGGLAVAQWLQPVTALALPPLAWLALQADGFGRRPGWRAGGHLVAPLAGVAARHGASGVPDLLVPAVFAGYALAMAVALWRMGSVLPRGRLGQDVLPGRVWWAIAAALALSALSDLAIATAFATGRAAWVPPIRDAATAFLLLGVGALALWAVSLTGGGGDDPGPAPSEDDRALVARLQALLQARRLWTDPDLTLTQLARRLQVPAKRLSAAVNRVTGESISRLVNGHRIRAACAALDRGAPVTEAMLEAGFATRSNFHREFRRVTGCTPGEWRPPPM